MDGSKRSSFEEIGHAASALRRFTRTPTGHRLGLKRSSTASTSSASVKSFESERQSSCVTRETCSDECIKHRFIVWAAVKRNACLTMTAEERRECPLLRCRQRFPNHELMLQHLYYCEHLSSGEYWCYDCGKSEQLGDLNCRRCLGHPSKRKKLMSLAKSVFSSLGRPKTSSLPPLNLTIGEEALTYYADLDDSGKFELQSNEIHEIDSYEVYLPTILEDDDEPRNGSEQPSRASSTATSHRSASFRRFQRPEQVRNSQTEEGLLNWEASPALSTVAPADLIKPTQPQPSAKPILQLNTSGLDYYRARSRRRSRNLQASSSIRSTSSTTSTNSTNSTSSNSSSASYNISPVSAWSGNWGRAVDYSSALTSPADDIPDASDALPCNETLLSQPHFDKCDMTFDQIVAGVGLSELPADVPMNELLQSDLTSDAPTDESHSNTPSSTEATVTDSRDRSAGPTDALFASHESQQLMENIKRDHNASASTLIQSARDTLDMHIAESMDKLKQYGKNPLINQFRGLSASAIVMAGLEALTEILRAGRSTSPLKLICLVHVTYSLSLVVHEQDAPKKWIELFLRAVSYCSWLPHHDRLAYIQVVDFLWKPSDLADDVLMSLLKRDLSPQLIPSSRLDGKASMEQVDINEDPLMFVSCFFLDELEFAALHDSKRPEIQASDLCIQHLKDANIGLTNKSSYHIAVNDLILALSQRYNEQPGYISTMRELLGKLASNRVSTVRRLELELMQCGKMQLPADLYFDDYVQMVRAKIDSLHEYGLSFPSRPTYHQLGVKLMMTCIQSADLSVPDQLNSVPTDTNVDLSDLDKQMSEGFDSFDFSSAASFNMGILGENIMSASDMSLSFPSSCDGQWLPSPTSPSGLIAPTASSQASSSPEQPTTTQRKTEADMCCEICGYRPKGKPKWFPGSMAKHKKLQHADSPPKIYPCPFPGCNSQYKNRPDNLRQHQIEKGHFVDGQDGSNKSRKRRKLE